MTLLYFLLLFPLLLNALFLNSPPEYQPGYGYIGPACAVFDGTLFLHGVSKRKLNDHELHIFSAYQDDLSTFKDSSSSFDSFEASFPSVPKFCGGYDDSIEVVLDSCIVRNNHVYVGDHLIRALTNFEKQKVQLVKMRRMYGESRKKRVRRSSKTPLPGTRPQRDFSEMLHKLLNINSTVTSRFLPVVSQSPLFAMEGPWQHLIELGKDKDMMDLLAATQFKPPPAPQQPSAPLVDITKIDSPYRATFTTMKPRKSQKPEKKKEIFNVFTTKIVPPITTTSTTTTSTSTTTTAAPTTTTTPRQISLQTLPPATTSRPVIERTRPFPSPSSSSASIQTVVDPIILQLISKALEKNELIDEQALKQALSMRSFGTTSTALPLRFIVPTSAPSSPFQPSSRVAGLSHNHLFIPHQPFTSLASSDSRYSAPNPLSHRLPNEICRVHANSNPFNFNF
ncbi:unnamed protein product [Caenorhabditis sp. 36 PRJEB53466]|nr:unnamed protein product [Caenorhabditis sp. 36 PRJEB53466]